MHKDRLMGCIELIFESVELIERRFSGIQLPEDFVSSPEGVTLLDAVSMRLQVIGESVRKIQKLDSAFLVTYPDIEWDKLARFRDLVSHHYADIDHEIVFDICKTHMPMLKKVIEKIRGDLEKTSGSGLHISEKW
jgi:uncharacterized protein with HEPN domain